MTPAARDLRLRAVLSALDAMPEADDAAALSKALELMCCYAATLETLAGFKPEEGGTLQ